MSFIDRGDPASYDFTKADLTTDGAWHELDLTNLIPLIAKAVLLGGRIEGNGVGWTIKFRTKGNDNEINHCEMETLQANVERYRSMTVATCGSQIIEYKADNQAWTTLDISVRGWWTE